MAARIEFHVLGPVEAYRDGERLELGGAKRRALLAQLLLRRNEPVPVDRLIAGLWSDAPPETAPNTLQVNVSQLRKVLGPDRLLRDGGGYLLRVDEDELDLARFEAGAAAGRAALAAGEPAAAADAFESALAEWRGAALGDVLLEPFAAVESERLEEARLAVAEDRAEAALALGGGPELLGELEGRIAEQPYRERSYGHLMLALYRAGRQADALDVYRRARATLADELGLEPSPQLRRLEQAILAHDPVLEPAVPAVSALPAPTTPLVGRRDELGALERLLREGRRLVTLTGPGGIGKTRLALELARRVAGGYRDGAVWVALADLEDSELVAGEVLQAVGPAAGGDAAELLAEELADRELLLVLDNVEQVIDAAPLVASLLEWAPGLVVVATSRELLRIAGEREFEVPPLASGDAVHLFIDRAGAEAAEDEETVAEICERLEGLPLAIELAAARVRLLPPPALLARLTSRLEILLGTRRDAPERQRTMRGAIEWSYRLLDPDEQVLFARLGVFAGGATLDAAAAVCGDVATLDRVGSLLDKSLLRRSGTHEPRFGMLETLREYALEQLAAMGEAAAVRRRHIAHFAALVAQAEGSITGPEQRRWLDVLEAEHANLRLAIAEALELDDQETALALAAGLRMFWYVHGHAEEGLRVLEHVLAVAGGASALQRTKAHAGAAMLASDRGDLAAVRRHMERSLALAHELGDPVRVAIATVNLGNVSLYEQDWDEAERLYREALRMFREQDRVRDQAIVLEDLALVALGRGDVDGAVATLEEAVERAAEAEAPHEIGSARLELARALLARGERERPFRLASEAFDVFRTLDARPRIADTLDTFSGIAAADGAYEDAARLLGCADALRRAIGAVRQPDQDRWVTSVVGYVRDALGEAYEAAVEEGRALSADDAAAALSR